MPPIFTFLCPVFVTGGTEAIHQANLAFNELGIRSQIAYYGSGSQLNRQGDEVVCVPAPRNVCLDAFKAYKPVVAERIHLDPRNLIIAPEINALEYQYFEPSRFVVWWLSVDNGLAHNSALADDATRSKFFAISRVGHWFQSEYARRFLLACGAASMQRLTDFTDAVFTVAPPAAPNAGHQILYNKKKGADLAEHFFAANPDLEALALDGMSKAQLADVYRSQAIYVDFGTLPGKDRMPREAAACGCTIFVHRRGAGGELGDFPIADRFRFDAVDATTGALAVELRKVLLNPDDAFRQQAHLRDVVARECMSFIQEARHIVDFEMRATAETLPARERDTKPTQIEAPRPAFVGSWDENRHRFCLWRVTPENYVHVHAFDDVMQGLSEAFAALGGSAPIVHQPSQWAGRVPIIFGGHLLPADAIKALPSDAIVFNLEQIDGRYDGGHPVYLSLLRRHAVLDFSLRNVGALSGLGVTAARRLPIGTMANLRRITPVEIQDIDVVFYGSMNERRAKILEALRACGLTVVNLFGVYGAPRDATIARAKVVLNLHFHDAAIFEAVRVSFLLENGCCVVTEGDEDDPDIMPLREGLAVCRYDRLVAQCVELVGDPDRRATLSLEAKRVMAACRQSRYLEELFAVEPPPARLVEVAA